MTSIHNIWKWLNYIILQAQLPLCTLLYCISHFLPYAISIKILGYLNKMNLCCLYEISLTAPKLMFCEHSLNGHKRLPCKDIKIMKKSSFKMYIFSCSHNSHNLLYLQPPASHFQLWIRMALHMHTMNFYIRDAWIPYSDIHLLDFGFQTFFFQTREWYWIWFNNLQQ